MTGTQLRKGILELAILSALRDRRLYGYELVRTLGSIDSLIVSEGTVYPILNRLKREAYVDSFIEESTEGPPRKYYQLTAAGRAQLERMDDHWKRLQLGIETLQKGVPRPEDWRLAYLCFALTIVSLLLIPFGIGAVFFIGAFLLARATVDLASDRADILGPRRWLIYPPLVVFYAGLLIALLMGPAGGVVGWGVGEHGFDLIFDHSRFDITQPSERIGFYVAAGSLTIGAWLLVLSVIVALTVRPLRWVFKPFANGLRGMHALWLTATGAVIGSGGLALLLLH